MRLLEHQQTEAADEITAQIEQMRQRIDHHLAIVRMRGPERLAHRGEHRRQTCVLRKSSRP